MKLFFSRVTSISFFCLLVLAGHVQAQLVAGDELADVLRKGGLVLVMRHTNSPRELPDAATVNPDNVNSERQLDDKGRRDATAIGETIRRLHVLISEVLSSPTYRALETARLAGFESVIVQDELSNEGMQESGAQNTEWLRSQVASQPDKGNRLLITHGPNLNAAFPDEAAGLEEGDTLVFKYDANTGVSLVARIKAAEWPEL
ncbi:MAG: histidine phosphatase family protein [Pseudomonadota bacterium]